MRITNLTSRPLVLDDGTIIAAAGTDGSSKDVEGLTDRDRKRLVNRGAVHVEETTVVEPGAQGDQKLDLPPVSGATRRRTEEKQ